MSGAARPGGRVAIVGAGPAGMAAALSVHQAGHDVVLFERYREARPAGNILNLWPPPIKALGLHGRRHRRPRRAVRSRSSATLRGTAPRRRATARGGRRRLRRRLHRAAAPRALRAAARRAAARHPAGQQRGRPQSSRTRPASALHLADGRTEEATSWSAPTASTPWSAARCGATPPSASTTCTSSAASPSTTTSTSRPGTASWSRTTGPLQGSWTSIRHKGRDGHQWWVLTAHDAGTTTSPATSTRPPPRSPRPFAPPLPHLIAATAPENVQRWVDPRPQTAQAVVEGARHARRRRRPPHLALRRLRRRHGHRGRLLPRPPPRRGRPHRPRRGRPGAAGRSRHPRKPHTAAQSQPAYILGQMFHHAPRAAAAGARLRSSTTRRSCRRSSATPPPARSSSSSMRSTVSNSGSSPADWVGDAPPSSRAARRGREDPGREAWSPDPVRRPCPAGRTPADARRRR